jgi:hypothetical protein
VDAPYQVFDGLRLLATVHVSPNLLPFGAIADNISYQSLGTYGIHSGTLRVALAPTAGPCIVADAVRLVQIPARGAVIVDNNQPGFETVGDGWTSIAGLGGYGNCVTFVAEGDGSKSASWRVEGLASGEYEVRASWTPYSNRATNAPFRIYDGPTLLATVRVNQQLAPSGLVVNGVMFQSLGVFPVQQGCLKVVLANDADSFVIADAIQVAEKPSWGPVFLTRELTVPEATSIHRAA